MGRKSTPQLTDSVHSLVYMLIGKQSWLDDLGKHLLCLVKCEEYFNQKDLGSRRKMNNFSISVGVTCTWRWLFSAWTWWCLWWPLSSDTAAENLQWGWTPQWARDDEERKVPIIMLGLPSSWVAVWELKIINWHFCVCVWVLLLLALKWSNCFYLGLGRASRSSWQPLSSPCQRLLAGNREGVLPVLQNVWRTRR